MPFVPSACKMQVSLEPLSIRIRALLWEFVGGKVEPGETKGQALIRECHEELAITLDEGTVAAAIPEKDSTVLMYCRSENRSKTASSALLELGYTNIYEFGGIKTWPYETES